MSLFQKSVEKKYLSQLDAEVVQEKYNTFHKYFGNPEIQENIRNAKEEQFQEGFLRELFVSILGYTLNPQPDFNLTTELKNIANSKKADGAIMKDDNAIAVIELKGTNIPDLDKVETQAFGYKNHHPKCVYVITSNFEKLRFYIHNAIEYLEFDLFSLTKEQFALLWLCLAKENLLRDIPLKVKESSLVQEENITKELYADYSKFRTEIYSNLVKNNPDTDKLLLFKKTQKLLDRFLFIFFAEDRLLLPPNSISEIIKQWKTLKEELDAYVPLYDRFKKYFGYMNTGYKGKKYEIYAYNGGLFAPDEVLDAISIDDELLYTHTSKLSQYDFETDVDVNILGHIFEHSLGEIENVQAEIKGEQVDTQKTKRKKDGIFYTPKYITKYIVENTVGKLCEEKRKELGIVDEEYGKGRKNRKKDTIRTLDQKLTDYRDWLLTLTILDPACGSGAFLNQALDFLIQEHKKVDELRAQLFGGGLVFADITNDILEKNIYGVDLNEESVEIAKLSLWLKTAQKGRKLNTLSNNIKCGNSLIDDPEVAGDKAFNWQEEFPHVFAKGGFDVVIGNPPYVQLQKMKEQASFLEKMNYKTFVKTGDLYCLFYEKGYDVLKEKAILGYITSNKWMRANYGKKLRRFFNEYTKPRVIIDLGSGIFESATVDSNILLLRKEKSDDHIFDGINLSSVKNFNSFSFLDQFSVDVSYKTDEIWTIESLVVKNIKLKIENKGKLLKNWDLDIFYGIKTGYNEAFIIDNETKEHLIDLDSKSQELIAPILRGRDIKRYYKEFSNLWLINTHNGINNMPRIDIKNYPAIKWHLDKFYEKLKDRYDKGDTPYNLRSCAYLNEFQKPKLYYPDISQRLSFTYDESSFANNTGYFINNGNKYLLAVLNSRLMDFYYKKISAQLGNKGIRSFTTYIEKIPIPVLELKKEISFIEKADKMLELNKDLQEITDKFQRTLHRKFEIEKLSKKLEEWHSLSYKEFTKELGKKKVKLSLSEEAEWEDYFLAEKAKAEELKAQISQTDKEIDQMVYELYDLTPEEIEIIENSTK